MKHTALSGLLGLAAAACAQPGSSGHPPSLIEIQPGQTFKLRVGERAVLRPAGVQVRFEAVLQDSRCPKGERCVWAGDATVRLWLHTEPAQPQRLDLTLSAGQGSRPGTGALLQLVQLDPYPVSGRAIAPADYIATLEHATRPAADATQ